MNTIDGFKGIMALDLDKVPRIYHDILIKQHKQDIENYKKYQESLPEELRYDNTVGKIITDKEYYDKLRDLSVAIKIMEDNQRFKELYERYN
tara:strand:+ start:111 stop:386 length:276 start_codon:yes stop_codon:yes gene_type:complete